MIPAMIVGGLTLVFGYFVGVWVTRGKLSRLRLTEEAAESQIQKLTGQIGHMTTVMTEKNAAIIEQESDIQSLKTEIQIHENKELDSAQKAKKALSTARELVNVLQSIDQTILLTTDKQSVEVVSEKRPSDDWDGYDHQTIGTANA